MRAKKWVAPLGAPLYPNGQALSAWDLVSEPNGQFWTSKWVGSVTSQDFIKFWGKFFAFVLLVLIENSQGFKTF
jgi:hypothetical protein